MVYLLCTIGWGSLIREGGWSSIGCSVPPLGVPTGRSTGNTSGFRRVVVRIGAHEGRPLFVMLYASDLHLAFVMPCHRL